MNEKITFKTLLNDKHFLKLLLAGCISRFGDAVDAIAYAYMVYDMTGSAVLMAALFAVNGIPSLVFNLVSGVVVSYWPKKRVIIICDFLRGSVVALTGVLFMTGTLHIWHLYLFTVLNSTFEAFRAPAATMLFVNLISKDKYEHATSLRTSARTLFELIGYGAAGAIIGLIGIGGAIIVDSVTFIFSGIIILSIVAAKEVLVTEKLTLKKYFTELFEGFSYVLRQPLIRFLTVFFGLFMLLLSPFNTMQTPFILDHMDLGPMGISVLSISFMVAMIIGGMTVPLISKKLGPRILFISGGIIMGIGYVGFGMIEVFRGTFSGYLAVVGVSLLMGISLPIISVPVQVGMMKKIDKALMTRVFAVSSMLQLSSVPIGGGIVGGIVNFVEIRTMFLVTGTGIILLFGAQTFNKSLHELNDRNATPIVEGVALD